LEGQQIELATLHAQVTALIAAVCHSLFFQRLVQLYQFDAQFPFDLHQIQATQTETSQHVHLNDEVKGWGPIQVCDWLATIGLAHLQKLFERNHVCGVDLLDMNHDDLLSIGLHRLGERKQFLRAVAALTALKS
jgi:hypothetical protein